MKKYGQIYMLKNKVNNKIYIGQTTNSIDHRIKQHIKEKRNRHISNALNRYGRQNFEVIELCSSFDQKELNKMETYFVQLFNSLHPAGYNHRAGGNQNGICSEQLRKKISQSKTGQIVYKLHGRNIDIAQRLQISRKLGGQNIIAVHTKTGNIKIYPTAHSTKKDGHNPSNIVQICKKVSGRRISKGYYFFYENDYVNQSGSFELKNLNTRNA